MSQCAGAGTRSSRRTSNGPWAPCPRPTAWASPAAAEPPLPRSWLSRAASPPGRDGRFSRCPCPWAEPPHRCSPGGDPGAQTTAGDRGRGGIPPGAPCVAAARPCLHPDTGPGGGGALGGVLGLPCPAGQLFPCLKGLLPEPDAGARSSVQGTMGVGAVRRGRRMRGRESSLLSGGCSWKRCFPRSHGSEEDPDG